MITAPTTDSTTAAIRAHAYMEATASSSTLHARQQRIDVVGMLFLDGENLLHHSLRRRILAVQPLDDLAVALDRDPLGDEVLAQHIDERIALDVLRVTPLRQRVRVEIGLTAELHDALGNP